MIEARLGRGLTRSCRPTRRPDRCLPRLLTLSPWATNIATTVPNLIRPDAGSLDVNDVVIPVGDEEPPQRPVRVGLYDGG